MTTKVDLNTFDAKEEKVTEKIHCIGPGALSALKGSKLLKRGFTPWDQDKHKCLIDGELTCTIGRTPELEEDPSFKQVIPYIMLSRSNEFFWYRRRSGAGQTGEGDIRLSGNISVGIGGHWKQGESFAGCACREYNEEMGGIPLLQVLYGQTCRRAMSDAVQHQDSHLFSNLFPLGLIWDESNAVGKVHLGVLLVLELATRTLPSGKSDLVGHECDWSSIEEIRHKHSKSFETWTKIAVEKGLAE